MPYFFHLLHRFLSDSYMVSLCPDLLEQHSTVSQYIPTSAAHLLTEKKRDYISSVLKNRAPCYTAHSMLIIYKAFYNKGGFYFTDLHFQTPTCSFHSSDVKFFFPVHPMPRLKTQNCYKCFQHFNVAEDSQSASRSGMLLCTSTKYPLFTHWSAFPSHQCSVPDYTYIIIRITTCLYFALFCSHRQGHLTHSSLSSDHLSSKKQL